MPKLLFVVTEDWYFVSHRLALAVEAVGRGYEVVLVTRVSTHQPTIEKNGIRVIPFDMNRRGMNPLGILREALKLAQIYRREKPDIVHHVALRTVVVGGLAARISGMGQVVSAVTGMGFLFAEEGRLPWIRNAVGRILPLLTRGVVIVQNSSDAAQMRSFGVPIERIRLIAGAGVDTQRYHPIKRRNERLTVMLAARLLWDKGVGEFVGAARLLQASGVRFVLVGMTDADNPSSVSASEVSAWVSQGIVEWWGHQEDMAATLAKADIFCLPSYREGLPKAILEAMASGLPCVTTDVPGCRDVVFHEETGLLVPPKDVVALAGAVASLLGDESKRIAMGELGRRRVVAEFSDAVVIEATMSVYRELQEISRV